MIMDGETKMMARRFMHQAVVLETYCANDKREQAQDIIADLEDRLFELKSRLRQSGE